MSSEVSTAGISSSVWLLSMGYDHDYQEADSKDKQNDANHHKDPVLLLLRRHEQVARFGTLNSRWLPFVTLHYGLFCY